MKKYASILVLLAFLPFFSAVGYEYNNTTTENYTTPRPVKANSYKKTVTNRKTGGYRNTITNNFYYTQPQNAQESSYAGASKRNGVSSVKKSVRNPMYDDYEDYDNDDYVVRKKQISYADESYSAVERKYFLAHPFFQPLKGRIGSVTDIAYAKNTFDFDILDGTVAGFYPSDPFVPSVYGVLNPPLSGKQEATQFLIKEDLSYGLTDSLAVVLMAQYDNTKVSLKDWSDGTHGNTLSDSGLNVFGLGLQSRFIDNDDWLAMASLSFLHQKNTANTFLGELKAGRKVDRSTIYGIGRLSYVSLSNGDIYGAFVNDSTGDYMMLSYNVGSRDILNVEFGVGAFAVVNKYITLNGELLYGHYDWHDQFNIKGAIGWQPQDSFALNLYATTSLYDSAKNKTKTYMNYDNNPTTFPLDANGNPLYTNSSVLYTTGNYKFKNYNEWKIGLQAILYF